MTETVTGRWQSMQQKGNASRTGYPYKILPFSDPSKIGKPLPDWVNEFFLIEALLRSEKVMEAHRPNDKKALIDKFREYGVVGHDPLRGTHHALLSDPIEDREWERRVARLGYVDISLNILDLGILAKLQPNEYVHHDNLSLCGSADGQADCLAYLRDTSPRFVCLRIDAAQPVETILKRLRLLLRERHKQVKQHSPEAGFYDRLQKTPFRKVTAWLEYFRCYDLFQSGQTEEAAGAQVYPRDIIATAKANTAIRRVKFVIQHAERVAHGQERARKERTKKPIKNRPFWPPHNIP